MPASSARSRKIMHDVDTRQRIKAALIINRFQACLDGKVELSRSQVTCGKTLLAKVLPDLSATTLSGDPNNPLMLVSKDQKDAAVKAATRAGS